MDLARDPSPSSWALSADAAYLLQEEVELAEMRLVKTATLKTRLDCQVWPSDLFKALTGNPLIGPAEFEATPEDRMWAGMALLLRDRVAVKSALDAFRHGTALAGLGVMPGEVLRHPRTPTYHRVVALLLGADLIPEEEKLRSRRNLLKKGLQTVLAEGGRGPWPTHLHLPHCNAFLTGVFTLSLPSDLASALSDTDPARKVLQLSRESFNHGAKERERLRLFLQDEFSS